MKKTYQKPTCKLITINASQVFMQASQKYDTKSTNNAYTKRQSLWDDDEW